VSGSDDRSTKIWDATSEQEAIGLTGQGIALSTAAFSPDGQLVVGGGDERTAKIWATLAGNELAALEGSGAWIKCAAFSPDGQRIVTGSLDQTAKVSAALTGRELLGLEGHTGWIGAVAFSPDGRRIVSGSRDHTTKVWGVTSGEQLLTLKADDTRILSATFSLDGRRIFTVSGERAVHVWAATTAKQVAAWQTEEETAKERLALLRRQQVAPTENDRARGTQDPSAIRQWLVLSPIIFDGHKGSEELDIEQIPQEAKLHPHPGERIKVGHQERRWMTVQLQDCMLDFNQLLGERIDRAVAYAICYIQSDADQSGLLMKVGSDDEAKI